MLLFAGALTTLFLTRDRVDDVVTGQTGSIGFLIVEGGEPNVNVLGRAIFTDYIFAFEITSVLLIIAVVGAVVLARTPRRSRAEAVAETEAAR
jgi:NADH:ubiquinone oxidoreductase subunit 6 (subunit J)